jgi:ABC-2 type transport system ATP-binding protein
MIATEDPAVAVVGAGHRYGKFWALRDCTLSLPAGSITAVVGPNGAGKTTLLNMVVGLLPATAGELRVVGEQPSSHPEFLAQVGFLAQDCPLYKEFSVADMLRFGRAMNPAWDDALARERIAAADVPLARRAGKLSGGQRAQVALALAVAKRPRVLLLDEPLAALDPLARPGHRKRGLRRPRSSPRDRRHPRREPTPPQLTRGDSELDARVHRMGFLVRICSDGRDAPRSH